MMRPVLSLLLTLPLLAACMSGPPATESVQVQAIALPSPTPLPTIGPIVIASLPPSEFTGSPVPSGPATPTLAVLSGGAFSIVTPTPLPDSPSFTLGTSLEGRAIEAYQFGDGPRDLVLVGAIHGGYELNTAILSELLIAHFQAFPEQVLPNIHLWIIPLANPDGAARGRDIEGRFNANGVDLNRNWGCEWSETAFLRDDPVDPGPRPFSEPETLLLRAFFLAIAPDVVLFYHSAAGGVFLGACGSSVPPAWLGETLENSSGYPYQESFDFYEVTGDASNWLAERGVASAVIELYTRSEPEFERNLRGVMAVQCYIARYDLANGLALPGLPEAIAAQCPESGS